MLGFGLFGRIWVRIGPEEDKALRIGQGGWKDRQMYIRLDRQTDSPYVLQDFVPFGAAAQKGKAFPTDRPLDKPNDTVVIELHEGPMCGG